MVSFLIGWLAGSIALNNRTDVRRGLATVIVRSEDVLAAASQHASRVAAQLREDLEDIVAEAQAEQSADSA
jgi:hypothetical protein